jgi:hypothetical protein
MSSPSLIKTSLLPLPEGQQVEVVIVKLADGRLVGRTREELEPAAGEPRPAPGR